MADISDLLGKFGTYQICFTVWICVYGMFSAFVNLDMTFKAPFINYTCLDFNFANSTDQCELVIQNSSLTIDKSCQRWSYDSSFYAHGATLTEKFNLVCSREWYASLATSIQQVGDLIAAITVSYASDRYGRRPICLICFIPGAIAVVMFVLVQDVKSYIVGKFLNGFSGLSLYYLTMVIIVETCGEKYRGFFAIVSGQLGYTVGYTLLPGIYWLIRDEHYFSILVAAFFALLLCFIWLIPESPRWFLLKQKKEECFQLVKRIRKYNKLKVDDEKLMMDLDKLCNDIVNNAQNSENLNTNIRDMVRGREMIKRSTIIFLCWFVTGAIYLGIAMTADVLGGDLYLNVFLLAIIEFPSIGFSMVAERRVGRRTLLASLLILTAVIYLVTIPVPSDLHVLKIILVVLGKFCVTSSCIILCPYTPELFPTSIRSTGVGISSGFASLGSILSPFFVQLTQYTSLSTTLAIFGVSTLICGVLVLFLPETKYVKLPETLADVKFHFESK